MQSGHDRVAQTNGYNHDSEQKFGDANKERNIYAQSYDMSGRFASNAVPAGYMPEEYFHRQPEMQFRDPELPMGVTDDTRHLPDYNYVQTSHAQSQPAQDLFAVPNARGTFDVTGQACPPGGSPGVTTTVWEDEGTLCFQVDARQTIVARREDNDMINGTKLLNVAQMSRGKRDGILKNEANRTVIKVGSMHLKGVWIPFDRALDLANKNHITDLLYPLFVKGIKKFLYHPKNYARTTAVLAAANSRHAQQIQPPNSMVDVIPEERIALDRSLSMPTPLDRSLSILTPPSSASTNSDYWTDVSAHGPISEIHARTHSLPGTPATTPPAPAYFAHGNGQQPIYPTSYHEARSSMSGNHYGQHPDMQRSYNHSRNASMVSYTEEDMTKENITSRLQPKDNFAALQPRIPINPSTNMTAVANSNRYQPPSMFGRALPNAENLAAARVTMDARNTPNISHQRTHSRTLSRNSNKTFNTPNLTTQMGRRASLTPSNSPASVQVRNASRVGGREQITHPSDASLWVQQQQHVTYSTPQQTSRGHLRQNSGQLPQIYEETPSCRMAYQLHGQGRLTEPFPRLVENKDLYHSSTGSPLRSQHNTDVSASPLNGKKKRERVVPDSDQFYKSNYPYEERQESLTPPPISKEESQESPKRRRSERNGMHSRSASVY